MLSRVSGCGIARTDQPKDTTRSWGVGPLHEASYLAPYEESESFAACLTYLQTAGDQTPRRSAISWRNL
jgi:hypothetical protein